MMKMTKPKRPYQRGFMGGTGTSGGAPGIGGPWAQHPPPCSYRTGWWIPCRWTAVQAASSTSSSCYFCLTQTEKTKEQKNFPRKGTTSEVNQVTRLYHHSAS